MNKKTWLIVAGVVVVVALIGLMLEHLSSAKPVEAAKVRRGLIRAFVDERGKTRLPETYLITMPYGGRIEPITLTEGMEVKEGQKVAQIVGVDLDLEVEKAQAVVQRLDAAIAENLDKKLEELAKIQADEFVKSMIETVKAAASRVESGRAKFDYAESNLGRIQKLFQSGTSTKDEWERAKLQKVEGEVDYRQDQLVLNATAALKAASDLLPDMVQQFIQDKSLTDAVLKKERAEADAHLQQVKLNKSRGTISSPVDGVVLERQTSNERYLDAGTTLLEIGRLQDLEVEVDVLSLDVVDAKGGDKAEIYGPAIGKIPADGAVRRIYPAGFTKVSSLGVEQQRVKVIVDVNPDDLAWLRGERELGVGYRVRVRVYTDEDPNALVVPRSALFKGADGQWRLYVIRDGRARTQSVEIGILNDEFAQVLSELKEGDLVVETPEGSLVDGQRVKVDLERLQEKEQRRLKQEQERKQIQQQKQQRRQKHRPRKQG